MSTYVTNVCLHAVNCAGFITFFYFPWLYKHVTACDVHVSEKTEMYNNAAFIVQIYISCKEKHPTMGHWHVA